MQIDPIAGLAIEGSILATAPLHDGIAIQRSFDAAAINAVCNHPDVNPTLSLGLGDIDTTELLADERNICLLVEGGGAIFHWSAPHAYAAHNFFLPAYRGKYAMDACRALLDAVFDIYGAHMVWAQTPVDNRACRWMNRRLGFKSEGVSLAGIFGLGENREVETFVLERG